MKILIAEDDANLRRGLAEILDREGYTVLTAANGRDALDLFQSQAPDFACLDIMMPGIDGYEACKRIKRDPETKHIPVVLLTGCSTRLDRVKGKMSGCDTYLVKPVSKDEFYQTLRKHLAEKATVR